MRLALVLGLTLLTLAAPRAALAQTGCASGGYSSFQPAAYSAYNGFASFPGATASGMLPPGYSTNPYGGCATNTPASPATTTSANPYDMYNTTGSPPTYSGTYASNVYNPYSGWGLTNTASYPFATYGNSASYTPSYLSGLGSLYNSFASFPGMAPSGYLTTGNAGYTNLAGAPANGAGSVAGTSGGSGTSPFASYNPTVPSPAAPSSGGYANAAPASGYTNVAGVTIYYAGANGASAAPPAATSASSTPSNGSYTYAAGVPIYYGGANASASGAGTSASFTGYGTGSGYNGYGTGSASSGSGSVAGTVTGYGSNGYYTYGNSSPSGGSYSGVSTMITFCGSGGRC